MHSRSDFTLIELLVVIAIIVILAAVVILTLNPGQLLKQSRDANRLSDLDCLNHALGVYQVDVTMRAVLSKLGGDNVLAVGRERGGADPRGMALLWLSHDSAFLGRSK